MPKKRKVTPKSRTRTATAKRRSSSSRVKRNAAARTAGRYVLPGIISAILLAAITVIGFTGYQTATASEFFGLRNVDIRGNERTPAEDIRRVVASSAQKSGVWNADLAEIRAKLEKFSFVRSAAVSRVLPGGIRVNVTERVPAAVVHLSSGDFLVDGDAVILASVTSATGNNEFPFILKGWDEAKTEKAATENLARLKLYKRMLDDWRQFDLSKRVKEVNLAELKDPTAVVEDSGRPITVSLAKDNLGKSLKTAIEAVSGKGAKIRSVNAAGLYPVIQFQE